MPARVADAHVVVGKSRRAHGEHGGLLAAGRPMVVAGATCPGNGDDQRAPRRDGGAGVTARPEDVGAIVHRWRETQAIARMGSRARQLVLAGAADRVVDVALRAQHEVRAIANLRAILR